MASDPKRITITNNVLIAAYSAGIEFGSGSATCFLAIDGQEVDRALARERGWETSYSSNGFVRWGLVHIPVDEAKDIALVEFGEGYYPGGKGCFKGSGRSLLKRLALQAVPWRPSRCERLLALKKAKAAAALAANAGRVAGGSNVPCHVYSKFGEHTVRLEEVRPQSDGRIYVTFGGRTFAPQNYRIENQLRAEVSAACN